MELYLQFGFGMMDHCRQLVEQWGQGTVVLSPRDLTDRQLVQLSSDITALPNGAVLLDPQFYLPHSDHQRLCSHSYWPDNYETAVFWQGQSLNELLTRLLEKNNQIGAAAFILPGLLADRVDDDWLEVQRLIADEAANLGATPPRLATIALSSDATRDTDRLANLVEAAENWPVAGYYIVAEHPNGDYLTDDPNWLANLLDLAGGLRLFGRSVIIGYCNHQILCAAAVKVNAICSGTWMNVRSFPPNKFQTAYDDEIKQRSKWYYCPHALSEYKIPFLDVAWRQGIIDDMRPQGDADGGYATDLFSGVQPSTVDFTEQAAFRHYLHALRSQVLASAGGSFDDTITRHDNLLNNAEGVLRNLHASGVLGQNRDFMDKVDVNRAALAIIRNTRGPMLRHRWPTL